MAEDRLKLAVFIDFDNIQIGVKETLDKDFDVGLVLEVLKERGEVVSKIAYGDWSRTSEQSRQMAQHAVQMVQRIATPRGDKNGADINLALDALEMAFTRHHINAFAIVGGDSDFIALVEKLKQYDKHVFVVGGRQFTSHILQRNCNEFIAYENLLKSPPGLAGSRPARSLRAEARAAESRPLSAALPSIRRALKILADREVAPQVGLLKSTMLQLDPTFSERDYGAGSFLEFMQKMHAARLLVLRKTDRGHLVELVEGEDAVKASSGDKNGAPAQVSLPPLKQDQGAPTGGLPPQSEEEALALLTRALSSARTKSPNRPVYMRNLRQMLRSLDEQFEEGRFGRRGLLDLLHRAQREGLITLHRDRRGAWRVFPASPAGPAPGNERVEPALGTSTDKTTAGLHPGTASSLEASTALTSAAEPVVRGAEVEATIQSSTAGKRRRGSTAPQRRTSRQRNPSPQP